MQATVHFDPGHGHGLHVCAARRRLTTTATSPSPTCRPSNWTRPTWSGSGASLPELPAARKERLVTRTNCLPRMPACCRPTSRWATTSRRWPPLTGDATHVGQLGPGRSVSAYLNAAGLEVADRPYGPGPGRTARAGRRRHALRQDGQGGVRGHDRDGQGRRRSWPRRDWARSPTRGSWRRWSPASWQANPGPAEEFRQGRDRVLGFFVGQVMKETKGQANPQMVNDLLRRHLAGRPSVAAEAPWSALPSVLCAARRTPCSRRVEKPHVCLVLCLTFSGPIARPASGDVEHRAGRSSCAPLRPDSCPVLKTADIISGKWTLLDPARPLQRHQPLQRAGAFARGHQPQDPLRTPQGLEKAGVVTRKSYRRSASPGGVHAHRHGLGPHPAHRPHAGVRRQVADDGHATDAPVQTRPARNDPPPRRPGRR